MDADRGDDRDTKKAEIDTRAPFRSVKEAVMLFGERVLAGEVYAHHCLRQTKIASSENRNGVSRFGEVTSELEETKQSLTKAIEEGMLMADTLDSLKQELEHTKRELQHLKAKESEKLGNGDSETKDVLKYVAVATPVIVDKEMGTEFQNKRYVKFANPPALAQVISPTYNEEMLERHPSLKKKKKKPLIPLIIGGIFSKKKTVRAP